MNALLASPILDGMKAFLNLVWSIILGVIDLAILIGKGLLVVAAIGIVIIVILAILAGWWEKFKDYPNPTFVATSLLIVVLLYIGGYWSAGVQYTIGWLAAAYIACYIVFRIGQGIYNARKGGRRR